MASCKLRIQLDEPNRVYRGGETVSGQVTVQVDKDVKCKGLVVKSTWATHGRGNVASDTHREEILFQGNWRAGTTESYRFNLECGNWPPTYHGHYLNVDHYISAQADIPWAIDPKAKQPFQLVPSPDLPLKAEPEQELKKQTGLLGKVIGVIFISIFCVIGFMFVFHPCIWIMLFVGGLWWFITKYLPRRKLGDIEFNVRKTSVQPGGVFEAELLIQPKGRTAINGVNWILKAEETCVHGHGTNSTTHKKTLIEEKQQAAATSELIPNQVNRFLFEFPLPDDAPLSLELKSNSLRWTIQAHVDIPNWPDWKKSEKLKVVHSGDVAQENQSTYQQSEPTAEPAPTKTSAVSFAETAALISRVRTDFDQLDRILAAVANIEMQITARPLRLISVGTVDPAIGYPDGQVMEAADVGNGLSLLLYVPRSKCETLNATINRDWTGPGVIVGYDKRIGSLQIKLS